MEVHVLCFLLGVVGVVGKPARVVVLIAGVVSVVSGGGGNWSVRDLLRQNDTAGINGPYMSLNCNWRGFPFLNTNSTIICMPCINTSTEEMTIRTERIP